MATNFPTSLQDLDATRGASGDPLSTPNHATHHQTEDDTLEALQAKVGVDSSAVTSSHDYKLSSVTSTAKAVPDTRTITATSPVTIDGGASANLTANRTIAVGAASTTASGVIEVAIASEVNTGTDATRAVSPDSLSGSYAGTKVAELMPFLAGDDVTVGDGAAYFTMPSPYNGMNLVAVHARVITAGTTGTTDVQIANVTQAADMLSTKLTIDSGETGSDTAATPAVIDTGNDDVATNDLIRVDVDATSTTKAKGLIIRMEFQLP